MEEMLGIALGLGLSAACGFRVFVPLLIVSAASMTGAVSLSEGFAWMGSWPALITFASATVLEIGGYYFPWLDNFLDALSTPAAVVAGIVLTAACITGIDPALKWILAIIAGGGVAGAFKLGMAKLRLVSSLFTGGTANPAISTAECGGSVALSVTAVAAPLAALLALLVAGGWIVRRIFTRREP